ncbi:MAG: hypothetical protein J2P51_11110, partial [Hyphomicrobiaceae bacterium]|nr:hypothetical protein [Hyphomicrobiaceae bacterium]
PDHPDVRAGKPHRCRNQWPRDLPGFREDCLAYAAALEQLGAPRAALALALDLPGDPFREGVFQPDVQAAHDALSP